MWGKIEGSRSDSGRRCKLINRNRNSERVMRAGALTVRMQGGGKERGGAARSRSFLSRRLSSIDGPAAKPDNTCDQPSWRQFPANSIHFRRRVSGLRHYPKQVVGWGDMTDSDPHHRTERRPPTRGRPFEGNNHSRGCFEGGR